VAPRRQVRLPVETGSSAITILVVGTLVAFALTGGMVAFMEASPVLGGITFVLWVAALGVTALGVPGLAAQRRAADVLIDEDEIRVDGGPQHGFRWERRGIELGGTGVEQEELSNGVTGNTKFFLDLGTGIRVVLAESGKAEDIASMKALEATLQAWVRGPTAQGQRATTTPEVSVLTCSRCGATVAPTDKAASACGHCGHQEPMPADLVEKVRAAKLLPAERERSEKMVRSLLRQPGAHAVNILLTVLGIALFVVLPATLIGVGVWAFAVAACSSIGLVFFVRLVVSNRRALRLMELNFGARAPNRQGDPWSCRRCGGPLPSGTSDEDMVARCMYCSADNILGVDLRGDVGAANQQSLRLDETVKHRRKELVTNTGTLVIAIAAGIAGTHFAYGKHVEEQVAKEESQRLFPAAPPAPHIKRSAPSATPAASGLERLTKQGEVENYVSSTPDGRHLIMIRRASEKALAVVRELPSGKERVLDTLDFTATAGRPILTSPVLAQDGRSLFAVRWDTTHDDVRLVRYTLKEIEVGEETAIHVSSMKTTVARPLPWPDGATVVFSAGPLLGTSGLLRRSLADSQQVSLGEGIPYAVKADGMGLLIGRVEQGLRSETRLVLLEGPKLERSRVLTSEGWSVSGGVLSPDGKRAAFLAKESHPAGSASGVENNLFGVSLDAGAPVALVGGYAAKGNLAWGIDGYIYFISDEGGTEGVYRVKWEG
jgi:DNA-directed RNA polymerase subunit RPC12/RpoP